MLEEIVALNNDELINFLSESLRRLVWVMWSVKSVHKKQ